MRGRVCGTAAAGWTQKEDPRMRALFFFEFEFRLWSWRDSNPRPNRETIRFLHVYSRLRFRALARPGPPTTALAPKASSRHRGLSRLFPIYLHRLTLRFGTTSLERCLVPSPCNGIKPVIYCTSIRQRERNCFRQLIFDHSDLGASHRGSACLRTISSRCQIQSTPRFMSV